jgi:two-component system LytT family sensor kinase
MLVSLAWLCPALLAIIDTLAQQRIWGDPPDVRAALFSSGDWFLYALLTPAVFVCAKRWPLVSLHRGRRLALHLCLALIFCALWAAGGIVLKRLVQPEALARGARQFSVSWLFTTLPFGVPVYFAVVGIEHATRYFADARERELQVVRLSEQLTGARLAALQTQLNPHFLFNSLNTVTVLIRDGANAQATRVVEQLSDVLRLTLGRTNDSEITLADELHLVRQYIAVEQSRFSDRLRPTFAIAPNVLSAAVPAFALQHLVENAIRHGIARRTESGALSVAARRIGDALELTVSDDGPGIPLGAATPSGHGLANTRERLDTLYGDRASLNVVPATPRGTVATLLLPYRDVIAASND